METTGTSLRRPQFSILLLILAAALPLILAVAARAQTLGATLTTSLIATQGETLTYTAVITNPTSNALMGVTFSSALDPNTTLVASSANTSPLAFADTYSALGNVQISIAAPGLLADDTDPDGVDPALSVIATNTTSANGGDVAIAADGSFTYNPPRGFEGTDTFNYQLNDGEGFIDTGTVSISVTGMIWFVNSAAPAGGDGRLTNPFDSLASLAAVNNGAGNNPAAGDAVFLYPGDYSGPLTLLNSQKLIGQGAGDSLAAIVGLTPPTGSLALPATGGSRPTIAGSGGVTLASGNLVRGLSFHSGGATSLAGLNVGALTITEAAVTNTAGVAVSLASGALDVTFDSVTAAGGANGIRLVNCTGRFAVTGDGALAQNGTGGTIQNTSGDGVHLDDAENVSLSRMNINNSAANGLFGQNVHGIVIDWCSLNNNGDAANESGLRLGNPASAVNGLTGTAPDGENPTRIANTLVRASGEMNVAIFTSAGRLAQLEVTNVVSRDTRTRPLGADGFYFETRGGASATVNFTSCSFSDNFTQGIQAAALAQSVLAVNVQNCGFTNSNEGIVLANASDASLVFDINNNQFFNNLTTGASGSAIAAVNATTVTPTAIYSGKIRNNTINGGGIDNHLVAVLLAGAGQTTLQIANNTINAANAQFSGIFLQAGETGSGALNANATVTGNIVSLGLLGSHGIVVQSRISSTLCAEIANNTSTTGGIGLFGLNVRQRDTSTFRLPGFAGPFNSTAAVIAFLQSKNAAGTTIGATVATAYSGGAACGLPLLAMSPEIETRSAPSVAPSTLDGERIPRFDSRIDPGNRSSRRESALIPRGSKWRGLTSAATRFLRSAEVRGEIGGESPESASASLTSAARDSGVAPARQGSSNAGFASGDISAPVLGMQSLFPPLNIGTLPPEKAITITFRVTIADPVPPGTCVVSNQGTVTASGGITLLTDDPRTATPLDATLTAIPAPPIAVTLAATDITATSARLNGSVNPGGQDAAYRFIYRESPNTGPFSGIVAGSGSLPAGCAPVEVSRVALGLMANTHYNFTLVASNSSGRAFGSDVSFTTLPPSFTEQPLSTRVCAGNTAVFHVIVEGVTISRFQWQRRAPGSTVFEDIADGTEVTNSVYTTPPVTPADDGAAYRVLFSGAGTDLISEEATLTVIGAGAATFTYDFNDGLPPNTAIYGGAYVDPITGVLELNPNVGSQGGAFLTTDLAPERFVRGFAATFKARVQEGSVPPADGFSFNWAPDLPNGSYAVGEEGEGSGLRVCFDTWDNGAAEAPAIDVWWGSNLVARNRLPIEFLARGPDFFYVDIHLSSEGLLDLTYACEPVFSRLPVTGYAPQMGARFGLGSRTGGLWETHSIDDFALELYLDPTSNVPRITAIDLQSPTGILLSGTGVPDQNLSLEASTDLVSWAWRATVVADAGGFWQFLETDASTPPHRFYRLRAAPQFPPGLVTWWRADNGYLDSFGPNHGIPEGGMGFAPGQRGQSFSFNGTDSAVFIGGTAVPVPWTAAFWVNRHDTPDVSAALLSDNLTALKLEQWPSTRQVGVTQFGVADYYFNYITPANTWLHLTLVGTPAGTELYADGVAIETIAAVVNLPVQTLGRRDTGVDRLNGWLDDVTLFNRALTPAEIQQVIHATRGP